MHNRATVVSFLIKCIRRCFVSHVAPKIRCVTAVALWRSHGAAAALRLGKIVYHLQAEQILSLWQHSISCFMLSLLFALQNMIDLDDIGGGTNKRRIAPGFEGKHHGLSMLGSERAY